VKTIRKAALAGAILATASLLAACTSDGGGTTPPADDDPIIAGILLPATGPNGPGGDRMTAGIKIAVDELNANGGVLGRQIELTAADDEGTAAVAVSRAQELISQDIDVVFGGLASATALAAQPIFARAGITDIVITASADDVLADTVNPDAVRLNSDSKLSAGAIADFVNDEGFQRIVVLQQNDAYGESQGQSTISQLDVAPLEVITFDPKQTEFRVEIEKALSNDPDVVVMVNATADTGGPAMVQQLRAAGYDGPFTMAPTTFSIQAIELSGPAADGGVSAQAYLADKEPFVSYPGTKFLTEKYQAETGELPNHEVAFGYTAVKVWAAAAEAAKDLTRGPLIAQMRGHSFDGTPFGTVSFDERGQMSSTLQLYRVENGEIVTF